jgi:hypothetical protein
VVNQLTWAHLQLSANLQASDPAAIGRDGSVALAAASELERQSNSLKDLAGRLRQPGAWLSSAATVFLNSAQEQARRVQIISDLMGELGRALQSLAADLGSAKAAATAAVADSRRLNVVGDEVNLRAARELAMHPLLNSPSPAIEAAAAEVTAAQSGASTALWGAEANATSAWNRARASFDFVAEGTPAVHATWSDPNWDPAKSVHLGRPTGMSDGSLAWAGAPVGGMLMGPDQRDYHLEIGTALDTEGDRASTTANLPVRMAIGPNCLYAPGTPPTVRRRQAGIRPKSLRGAWLVRRTRRAVPTTRTSSRTSRSWPTVAHS